MKVLAAIVGLALAAALIVGLALGGWKLYWAASTSATNHQAVIFQKSYGTQTADIQQLNSLIVQVNGIKVQILDRNTPTSERPALRAQEVAIVNQACGISENITASLMPSNEATFVAANC